jgi:hypothetical protein
MLSVSRIDELGGQTSGPARKARPLADPDALFWTHADLAIVFGRTGIIRLVRRWQQHAGFPAALPWSRHPLKWSPAAVLRWKEARERAAGAL